MIEFKYEFCGLQLEIKAHYDEPEPEDWYISDGWIIDEARHKGVELDLVEMDIFNELSTAAQIAANEQYEAHEEP